MTSATMSADLARRLSRGLYGALAGALMAAPGPAGADLEGILSAVVGLRAEVPEDARTAEILGTRRVGSGVAIDGAGLVVTVGYLILEASKVYVAPRPGDAPEIPATVIAYDHDTGLGLVRAEHALDVTPMPLGASAELRAGDPVMAASYGGVRMARPALVVDVRDFAGYWEYLLEDALFTTPPHPMFGGAALIDPQGRLVGIGSLTVADAAGPGEAVAGNLFIPVDTLRATLGSLLAGEPGRDPPRPWLGLYTAEHEGALRIVRVARDGPAEAAGLREGETVRAVNERSVATLASFYRALWSGTRAGDRLRLRIEDSDGRTREVTVTSIDRRSWLRHE